MEVYSKRVSLVVQEGEGDGVEKDATNSLTNQDGRDIEEQHLFSSETQPNKKPSLFDNDDDDEEEEEGEESPQDSDKDNSGTYSEFPLSCVCLRTVEPTGST